MKERDDAAGSAGDAGIFEGLPRSAGSGRDPDEIAAGAKDKT